MLRPFGLERRRWVGFAIGLLVGCGPLPPSEQPSALVPARAEVRSWPQADALFRQDPRWLGGDAAYSVELAGGRRLWLFGDTFVADAPPVEGRRGTRMVRNSVAIQHGRDPSRARYEPFIRHDAAGQPTEFFPRLTQAEGTWEWPLHGIALGDGLVLFTQRVTRDSSELGFRTVGAGAYHVADARGPPGGWTFAPIALPERADLGLLGAAVIAHGEHAYVYAVRDPGDRALTLVRCDRASLAHGKIEGMEVWSGGSFALSGRAQALLEPAANELSVTARPGGGYVLVQSRGFGAAPIDAWLADDLTGPFSGPITLLDPSASGDPSGKHLVYAAKAHAGLLGAGLVVTYVESSLELERLLTDLDLYFPRVLRVTLPITP